MDFVYFRGTLITVVLCPTDFLLESVTTRKKISVPESKLDFPTTNNNHYATLLASSWDVFAGSDLGVLLKTPLAYELHAYVNESSKTSRAKDDDG